MARNLILDSILAWLAQIFAKNFFVGFTYTSRHCSKLSFYAV